MYTMLTPQYTYGSSTGLNTFLEYQTDIHGRITICCEFSFMIF